MYLNISSSEREALDHLISCMNKYTFGSREYELARKAFAFICRRIRQRELADKENGVLLHD